MDREPPAYRVSAPRAVR